MKSNTDNNPERRLHRDQGASVKSFANTRDMVAAMEGTLIMQTTDKSLLSSETVHRNPGIRPFTREVRLERVIQWALMISFALMDGFFASIREVNPTIAFQFDWFTMLATLVGGSLGYLFWRVIPRDTPGAPGGRRRWLPLFFYLMLQVGAMCFSVGYGIKDIRDEKLHEVLVGTGMAMVALTIAACFIWRVGKFFEDSHRHYLDEHPMARKPKPLGKDPGTDAGGEIPSPTTAT